MAGEGLPGRRRQVNRSTHTRRTAAGQRVRPGGRHHTPKKNRNVGFQRYDFVLGVSYQFWYQKRPNRNVAAIIFKNKLILFD